jgi:PAS domain S-box-containing protein
LIWSFTLYSLPLFLAALISLVLASYAWIHRASTPMAVFLFILMLAVSDWSLGYALELNCASLTGKLLLAKIEYLGIVATPLTWFVFVAQYTDRGFLLRNRLFYAVLVIPAVTLLLVFTNEAHGLIWSQTALANTGPFLNLSLVYGGWFWVFLAFSYVLLLLTTILLIRTLFHSVGLHRQQMATLLLAMAFPWAGNVLYLIGWAPLNHVDLTPFAYSLTGFVITWGIHRLQVLKIGLISHEAILSHLKDAIFVVDAKARLLDINPPALTLFDLSPQQAIGQPAWLLFSSLWPAGDLPSQLVETQADIKLNTRGSRRDFEFRLFPLERRNNRTRAWLAVLHDITDLKRTERRLKIQYDTTRILSEASRLEAATPLILQVVCENLDWDLGELWQVNQETQELQLVGLWQAAALQMDQPPTFKLGAGLPGKAGATGQPIWCDDLMSDPDFSRKTIAQQYALQAGLAFPFHARKGVAGVLVFLSRAMNQPVELLHMFEALGEQIGQFIERQQTQQALSASEAKYESLTNQLPIGVYQTSAEGKVLHANPAMAAILGYASVEELAQSVLTPHVYVDPQEREQQNTMRKHNPGVYATEAQFRQRDGTPIWVRDTGRAILQPDGEIDRFEGVIEDITERKQSEETLRQSEQNYRALFTSAKQQAHELALLMQVQAALARELDLETIFRTVVEVIAQSSGYALVSLYMLRDDLLVLQHQVGYSEVYWQIPITSGITGQVARTGQSVLLNNASSSAEFLKTADGIEAEVCVPLWDEGKVVGILNAESKAHALTEADLRIMVSLGEHVGVAIQRARLYTEARDNAEKIRSINEALQGQNQQLQAQGNALQQAEEKLRQLNAVLELKVQERTAALSEANAALTQEQYLLRTLLDNSPDRIYFKDIHSRFTRTSKSQAEMCGLSDPANMLGKTDFDLFADAHAWPAFQAEQQIIATGQAIVGFEEKETWPDGRATWANTTKMPLRDAAGKIVGTFGISRDITERKRAEEAALASEARYHGLYETIPVGLFRTTPNGHILMANPALVRMLGYDSFDELAQRNLEQDGYGPDHSRAEFTRQIEAAGVIHGHETGLRRKDGSVVFVRETGQAVRDAEHHILYYEGTMEDITEFHRSQQQNLRLVAAIDHAAEAVIVSDQRGQIQYLNPAFEKMFGITAKAMLGENVSKLSHANQDSDAWQAILKFPGAGEVWRGDINANRADGTMLEIEATISPVLGLDKEVSSLVYVIRDVTQERLAEMQHRQSQKLEAIGHLAAGIAHEINTPTQFIGNNLRFLQTAFSDLAPLIAPYQVTSGRGVVDEALFEKAKAVVGDLDLDFLAVEIPAAIEGSLKGIDRVTKIVGAMKEFSHPGQREKVVTNLNHAIENTLVVSHNEWKYIADLTLDLDPELPPIPCLVDEFNQVVLNLITNAVDAVRDTLASRPIGEKGCIAISTRRNGGWVVVRVSDTGPGIPASIRDRVFDPFFTTKEVGKGTGQGLSISYDVIVNKHSGKMSFETNEGQGTTFVVQLPLEPVAENGRPDMNQPRPEPVG